MLSLGRLYQAGADEWVPMTLGPITAGAGGVRFEVTRGLAIAGEFRDASGVPLERPIAVEALGRVTG